MTTTTRPASTLEQRFKDAERTTRTSLTPGEFGVVRLDGKAFHTYCKGLAKPFDQQFMDDMDAVAVALMEQVSGARLAFVQSDEISLILSDRSADGEIQQFVYGGQIQKLVSITAAIASTTFNLARVGTVTDKVALFDSRAFSLPDAGDVLEYLNWRQDDGRRNSLSMIAETLFTSKQLHGKSSAERHRMVVGSGVNPDRDVPTGFRNGRLIAREARPGTATYLHKRTGETETVDFIRSVPTAGTAPRFCDPATRSEIDAVLAGRIS